jgi:hypothetical protein
MHAMGGLGGNSLTAISKWNQDYALTRATPEDRKKYAKLSKIWPS